MGTLLDLFVYLFLLDPWEMTLLGPSQSVGLCAIGVHQTVLSPLRGDSDLSLRCHRDRAEYLRGNQVIGRIQLGHLPSTRPVRELGLPCVHPWRFDKACGCSFQSLSDTLANLCQCEPHFIRLASIPPTPSKAPGSCSNLPSFFDIPGPPVGDAELSHFLDNLLSVEK